MKTQENDDLMQNGVAPCSGDDTIMPEDPNQEDAPPATDGSDDEGDDDDDKKKEPIEPDPMIGPSGF